MKAKIDNPCSENWKTMKIGLQSRHCLSCQKNVIDFSKMDRKSVLQYLTSNREKSTCGRIYKSQLDLNFSDIEIVINGLEKQQKDSNLAFYLLTLSTIILMNGNYALSQETSKNSKIDTSISLSIDSATTIDKNLNPKVPAHRSIVPLDYILIGEISVQWNEENQPLKFADQMPEFIGGVSSLFAYIKQNLSFPEWEKKNNIQGIVYVQFVVDTTGKVRDCEIIRSVPGSKNFETEVKRVVNSMPDWIPGKNKGKHVDVLYTLPFKFKL
jgi:TonB family protein